MSKKYLERIATKIAESEKILQDQNSAEDSRKHAMNKIMRLSEEITCLEDMLLLDKLIQEKIQKS